MAERAHGAGGVPPKLPGRLTSFVGRETEVADVLALVRSHRLVTLTGAGGSGKTRLALEVAAALAPEHHDVRWIDLAPLTDPSLVPATLASALGMREPPEPVTDAVVRHLAERHELVVLDNCEHLVDACAALADELLRGCASVTVLATTRELLGVPGEVRYPVPPLVVPEDGSDAVTEAVQLFVERAAAAQPGFALTGETAPAVASICCRLDGIPLAIELAAARMRLLSVAEIADGLHDRFRLLVGSARGALPRQRTLEGSVDWSHDLLTEPERAALRRLAVFAGTFTLDGAEAVCVDGDVAGADVLQHLSSLVDRSLVQVADHGIRATRYRLLETIRDYARRRLADAGEAECTRDRHLRWCVAFSERAAVGIEGPDPTTWLAEVDAELPDIRAALDWSVDRGDGESGVEIVGNLNLYWFTRSEIALGRARLEATLARGGDGRHRAEALTALCHIAYRAGDMVSAARHGDEAIVLARGIGDARTLGRALHFRAWARFWGEADRLGAWAAFEEADQLLRSSGDHTVLALNLAAHAWSYIDTTRARRARGMLEDALALGGPVTAPPTLFALAWLDNLEGFARADAGFRECIRSAEEIGEQYIALFARSILAIRALDRGEVEAAEEQCAAGLALALDHRIPAGEASMRMSLATLRLQEGELDGAAAELEIARGCTPMPWFAALLHSLQARVALARSQTDDARRHADAALLLGRKHDSVAAVTGALSTFAALAVRDGDLHAAEDLLHDALELAHEAGFTPYACITLTNLSDVISEQGRHEEAARLRAAAAQAAESREATAVARFWFDATRSAPSSADPLGSQGTDDACDDRTVMSLDDAIAYARRGRGRRRRPSHGWPSLTPTERKVVELVTRGLTNPQIGQELFVSPRTVQTHLAHVFAKLQVTSRSELAVLATQHALGSA